MKISCMFSSSIRKFLEYLRKDYYFDFLILFFVFMSIYWSHISIEKYLSLNASVWDLGVAYLTGMQFLHDPLNPFILIYHSILFLIFPVFLSFNMEYIIIFQDVSVLFGGIVLYLISKEVLKNKPASLIFSMAYMLYPPLTGIFWFDFHYQAFFIPFYFLGYYLFIRKMYKSSIFFFIFAGLSRFPYILLVVLTGFIFFLEEYFKLLMKREFSEKKLLYSLILFLISLSILLISYIGIKYIFGGGNLLNVLQNEAHYTGINNTILDYRIFMLFIVFFPLMGLPFLSKRFLLLYLPFLYITLWISYWGVVFPGFLHKQYSSLYVPFIFIATLEAIREYIKDDDRKIVFKNLDFTEILSNKTRITAVILILTVLSGLVYQPWGPFNELSLTDFHVNEKLNVNMERFDALMKIINVIPSNASILVQNNLPQVYMKVYDLNVITSGMSLFSQNFTYGNEYVKNGSSWTKYNFNYILMDIDSIDYYIDFNYISLTMYNISNRLFESNHYGIMTSYDGLVLLKENYYGKPLIYKGIYENINVNQTLKNKYINAYNLNLTPGIYEIKLYGKFNQTSNITLYNSLNSHTKISKCTFNDSYEEEFIFSLKYFISGGYLSINNTNSTYIKNITIEELQPISYYNQSISPDSVFWNSRQGDLKGQEVQNYFQSVSLDFLRRVKY